jgi:hypothetical protein
MGYDEFVRAMRAAVGGSRKILITFKQDSRRGVLLLVGMIRQEQITVSEQDQAEIIGVMCAYRWREDSKRRITVNFTLKFRHGLFLERMSDYLEAIEVVN